MEIDAIIEKLNAKITSQRIIGIEKLDANNLTETEKAFIEKYNPVNSFIAYGTLAPDKPNHYKIEHIEGKWLKGIVKGKLVKEGWGAGMGYFGFKPSKEQKHIEASILVSERLINHWAYLDEFEGSEYKRILAKYELENGEIGIGNIYAIK